MDIAEFTPETSRIFFALCYGKSKVTEIARLLKKKRTTVSDVVNKLYRLKLARKKKKGRDVFYSIDWNYFYKLVYFNFLLSPLKLKETLKEGELSPLFKTIKEQNLLENFAREVSKFMFEYKEEKGKEMRKVYEAYFRNYTLSRFISSFFISLCKLAKNKKVFSKKDKKTLEKIRDYFLIPTMLEELILKEVLKTKL
jgi:predicted transcriptional regulator